MKTAQLNDSLMQSRAAFVRSEDRSSRTSVRDIDAAQQRFDAWTKMIEMLRGWQVDPRRATDDDYEPPSQASIETALRLARAWQAAAATPATRMVPTGEGGISFEQRCDPAFLEVEVERDGSAELLTFLDCKLVGRMLLVSAGA